MARFRRLETLNAMVEAGLIPVFYQADVEVATQIVQACATGGARAVEFTNRGDFAYEVFAALEKFCRKNLPQVILGVGSIVDAPTAALYIASGANFVVGPLLNAEVARLCNRRKIPYSPGCGSATEIAEAEELGCEIVKVFPGGQVGGPAFVKNVLGPCPWSSLMPTGGVDATHESISAWVKAGVVCVGMGSNLITKDLLNAGDYEGLAAKIRETVELIRRLRGISAISN